MEVGGIDRPLLEKSETVQFDGMDIEYREKCNRIYDNFFVQSIEQPMMRNYNLIISITLLEHVPNNRASLESCYASLAEDGVMMHYTPSKWHPYAIILRLMGNRFQKLLISLLRPDSMEVTGYPTYFHLCSPMEMKKALSDAGFMDIKIIPFYNATDYFAFFFPFYFLIFAFEKICKSINCDIFCSGFIFSAVKPNIHLPSMPLDTH